MPSDDTNDDFFDPETSRPAVTEMQYLQAYRFIADSPQWMMNVLLVGVCNMIPVVGPIVAIGYQHELIEALHRRPKRPYPDFDFNRFVEYLTRGLWPFLVSLVASVVLGPVGIVLFLISMFGISALHGAGADEFTMILIFGVVFVLITLFLSLLGLIMIPAMLRAGLAQDFAAGFDFGFIKEFISKVWIELLLSWLFLAATAMVLMLVGMMALYFGIFFAIALLNFAQGYVMYQLYELHLARGGKPIPLKPEH